MIFSSLTFLYVFLPLLMAFYFIVPGRGKNIILMIFSLMFYAYDQPEYVWLPMLFCIFNFVSGRVIGSIKDRRRRRVMLAAGLCFDLGGLICFKSMAFLELPLGISFLAFQTAAYLIDVFREDIKPCRNILDFSVYVTFFGKLTAGPIVRYGQIKDALAVRRQHFSDFSEGMQRFCIGLAKKVIIADNIGNFCRMLEDASQRSVLSAWLLAVGYVLWIYYDFSGYSDMAVGLGKIFGFDFPENFCWPLAAGSVTDFWRRWHMTLSGWFKDYVYIPLGGSRRGRVRQILNLAVVWILTGLWHGTAWKFVIWGLFFALMLAAEKVWLLKWLRRLGAVSHIYMFVVLTFAFVWFQSPDSAQACRVLSDMLGFGEVTAVSAGALYALRSFGLLLAAAVIGAMPAAPLCRKYFGRQTWYLNLKAVYCIGLLILCTAYLTDATYHPFIYFQF